MAEEVEGSRIAQVACVVLFGGIGITMLWVFFAECYHILSQLNRNPDSFDINKGSLYGLGFGLLGLMMTYAIVYLTMTKRSITGTREKVINWGFLASFLLLLATPQIIHIPLDRFLTGKGYFICKEQSYTWFFYKHLIYAKDNAKCS